MSDMNMPGQEDAERSGAADLNLPPDEQADHSGPIVDPDDLLEEGREEPGPQPGAVPPPD